ncbi:putative dUTPase [Lyophyllum atratum]|nr:putative dUTPase [Lyophyllum atratum]
MLLPGKQIVSLAIIRNMSSPLHQIQPCGVDLSLKSIFRWKTAGVIDFDNSARQNSATEQVLFQKGRLHIEQGAYLIQFNETVVTPLDVMGEIFVRSSVFRSGAVIQAGLMDAGYHGSIGE